MPAIAPHLLSLFHMWMLSGTGEMWPRAQPPSGAAASVQVDPHHRPGVQDERVALLLLADGAGGAVARQHQGLVGKDEELVADAAQEHAPVAPRPVEASDARLEEDVACEDNALTVVAEVAVGVARAVEHLEAQVAYRKLVAVVDELLGLGERRGWVAHHLGDAPGLAGG